MADRERYLRWYLAHREEISVRRRAYYQANKERIKARRRKGKHKLEVSGKVRRIAESYGITRAEARKLLGLPPLRKYTRHP